MICMESRIFLVSPLKVGGTSTVHAKKIVIVKDIIFQEMPVNCMDNRNFLVLSLKVGGTSTVHAENIVFEKDIIFQEFL